MSSLTGPSKPAAAAAASVAAAQLPNPPRCSSHTTAAHEVAKNAREPKKKKKKTTPCNEDVGVENTEDFPHASKLLQRCHLSPSPQKVKENASFAQALCPINANSICLSRSNDAIPGPPIECAGPAEGLCSADLQTGFEDADTRENGPKLLLSTKFQIQAEIEDAQESSGSFTVDSDPSHTNDSEQFVVWSNAVFCCETWDMRSCDTTSSLRSWEAGASLLYKDKQATVCSNGHVKDANVGQLDVNSSALSSQISGNRSLNSTASAVAGSNPPVLSEDTQEGGYQLEQHEVASSVGSSPADHEWHVYFSDTGGTIKQARHCEGPFKCPLTKKTYLKEKIGKNPAFVSNMAAKSSKMHIKETKHRLPTSMWMQERGVHEEDRVRAELEIEIEKDLEKEIKSQIVLLTRRLADLHSLQVARYTKQQQPKSSVCQTAPKSVQSYGWKQGAEKVASCPKVGDVKTLRRHSPANLCGAQMTEHGDREMKQKGNKPQSTKKNLTTVGFSSSPLKPSKSVAVEMSPSPIRKGVHFSYASSPVTNWRRTPVTADKLSSPLNSQRKEEGCSVDGHITETDMTRTSKAGATQKASRGSSLATWTSLGIVKKFDWVKTLRAGVSSTPRLVSKAKLHDGSTSSEMCFPASSLSARETSCSARLARNLFSADNLSPTPPPSNKGVATNKGGRSKTGPLAKEVKPALSKRNRKVSGQETAAAIHKRCGDPDIMHESKAKEKQQAKVSCTRETRGNDKVHKTSSQEIEISQQAVMTQKEETAQEEDSLDALVLQFEDFLEGLASGQEADSKALELECGKAYPAPPPSRERFGRLMKMNAEAVDCLEEERGKLPKIKTCNNNSNNSSPRNSGCVKRSAERRRRVNIFSLSEEEDNPRKLQLTMCQQQQPMVSSPTQYNTCN